jgi:MotA/TolQ/ExbB proton channel family
MSPSSADIAGRARRPSPTVAAFLIGVPLAALIIGLVHFGPLRKTVAYRYLEHPVECAEVVLFCCALGALGAKLLQSRSEIEACHAPLLPRWDGKPHPIEDAVGLLAGVRKLTGSLHHTYLGRRITAILEFLCQRRSANDLDDHLRTLSDNDGMALENSYALTRFITWAIPILGFLGTVLGITGAIAGVSPEKLAEDISAVTDGLAEAFDCTALALALTMVTMFISFLVERQEQSVLEAVDHNVDRQLAHRFQRSAAMAEPFVQAVQQNTQALMTTLEQVVQRQAQVWADAMNEPERRAAVAYDRQQDQLTAALGSAMEQTLTAHAQRLAALEQHTAEATAGLMRQLADVAGSVRETGREQQVALMRVAESINGQAAVLGKLQENENNLVHLQAVLHQNLAALASASNFEQAVHSLTAVAHLLTARATGSAPAGHSAVVLPRQQGKAA